MLNPEMRGFEKRDGRLMPLYSFVLDVRGDANAPAGEDGRPGGSPGKWEPGHTDGPFIGLYPG